MLVMGPMVLLPVLVIPITMLFICIVRLWILFLYVFETLAIVSSGLTVVIFTISSGLINSLMKIMHCMGLAIFCY